MFKDCNHKCDLTASCFSSLAELLCFYIVEMFEALDYRLLDPQRVSWDQIQNSE